MAVIPPTPPRLCPGRSARGSTAVRRAAGIALAIALAGCGSAAPSTPASTGRAVSTISTDPAGLRTFTLARPNLCLMPVAGVGRVDPPVSGILEHLDGAPEPVMLRTDDGADLSVVWPEGFHVRNMPEATLLDDRGGVIARAGDRVVLDSTWPATRGGEYAYPYYAHFVNGKCYSMALTSRDLPPITP